MADEYIEGMKNHLELMELLLENVKSIEQKKKIKSDIIQTKQYIIDRKKIIES